ncbi:MAG: transposase [Candidatus Parcubacteria bacterium]|nr:transposase [Candidatus Parcubacteria bacterium]
MRVKKKYSAAQKFASAMSVIKGEKSAVEAARDLGCHPTLIGNWKEAVLKEGALVFEKENSEGAKEQRIAKLERLIGKLTVQNDFLEQVLDR